MSTSAWQSELGVPADCKITISSIQLGEYWGDGRILYGRSTRIPRHCCHFALLVAGTWRDVVPGLIHQRANSQHSTCNVGATNPLELQVSFSRTSNIWIDWSWLLLFLWWANSFLDMSCWNLALCLRHYMIIIWTKLEMAGTGSDS